MILELFSYSRTVKYITRTVWVLSLVSLFTDMASEMLYPIMPFYLKSIGFSVVLIGILEGVAEAVAGLSKGYFGKWSDVTQRRLPFVRLGYSLSAISKPMMALFTAPLWIFTARTIDRLGKGIRTGARDAMLSDETSKEKKGSVFGFHRAMDTFGAAIGPAIALAFLYFNPGEYKTLFIVAFLPGIVAIALTFVIKEKKQAIYTSEKPKLFSFFSYWKESPAAYRKFAGAMLVFTIFNSSDVFLLLKARQSGLSDTMVIGVYIFYNMVYALVSFPLGIISDKFGLKKMLVFGLILFSIVYAGMSLADSLPVVIAMFFLYGLYAAATEGVSKALISNIVEKKEVATALGTYSGFQSICLMISSSLTGFIWYQFGSTMALMISAVVSMSVAIYFLIWQKRIA